MYQNLFIISTKCMYIFLILKDFFKLFHKCGTELDKQKSVH